MQNNLFVKWLSENLQRLFKKSPLFFKIWTGISGLAIAITGLPAFLAGVGIHLPGPWEAVENKVVADIAIGVFIMSLFPSQSNINSISPQGVANKQTDPIRLPFTAAAEMRVAEKEGRPTEIDPNVKTQSLN